MEMDGSVCRVDSVVVVVVVIVVAVSVPIFEGTTLR